MNEVNKRLHALAMAISDLSSEEELLCAMSERDNAKECILTELMTVKQKLSVCTDLCDDLMSSVLEGVTNGTEIIAPK